MACFFFKPTFICIQYYIDLFQFGWISINAYDKYTSKEFNRLIENGFNIEAERVVPAHKHHLCCTMNPKPKLFFAKVTAT